VRSGAEGGCRLGGSHLRLLHSGLEPAPGDPHAVHDHRELSGFQPGTGPAEYILMALERYQAAQTAMGKLFDIVFSVCIEGASA
jgi:hypothetical protein